jgi:hypothetical protein
MGIFKVLRNLIPAVIEFVLIPILLPIAARNENRARMIERIATAVAEQLLIEFPEAQWPELIELAISRLAEALPPEARTSNKDVLKRAVTVALSAAGAAVKK